MKKLSANEMVMIAVAFGGAFFVFGDKLVMKLDSWKHAIRDSVEEQMPLEVEIERARRRTAELVTVILKQREVVVRQSIDVDNLRTEIAKAEKNQAEQKKELLALRASLSTSETQYTSSRLVDGALAGKHEQLESAFEHYQMADATLDARREVLRIRVQTLFDAQKQLHAVEESRKQLQLQVENLVARLELVRAKSGTGSSVVDKESMAQSASQLRRLDDRLKFMEGMLDEDRTIDTSTFLTSGGMKADIGSEVDQYFGIQATE
jgi:chromosome segregation ATPase